MIKPLYVRSKKSRVWHVAWRNVTFDGAPMSCCGTMFGLYDAWYEVVGDPGRVCKACVNEARKEVEYLKGVLDG